MSVVGHAGATWNESAGVRAGEEVGLRGFGDVVADVVCAAADCEGLAGGGDVAEAVVCGAVEDWAAGGGWEGEFRDGGGG